MLCLAGAAMATVPMSRLAIRALTRIFMRFLLEPGSSFHEDNVSSLAKYLQPHPRGLARDAFGTAFSGFKTSDSWYRAVKQFAQNGVSRRQKEVPPKGGTLKSRQYVSQSLPCPPVLETEITNLTRARHLEVSILQGLPWRMDRLMFFRINPRWASRRPRPCRPCHRESPRRPCGESLLPGWVGP